MKHLPTRSERALHELTAGLVGDCASMLQAVINNRMDNLENIKDRSSHIARELLKRIRALKSLLPTVFPAPSLTVGFLQSSWTINEFLAWDHRAESRCAARPYQASPLLIG